MRNIFTLKRTKKKTNWRKGSAELIGIALAMPLLCALLIMVVGIIQSGILRQTMEYAAYTGARAAVVCDNQSDAMIEARSAALMALEDNTFGVDIDEVNVSIALVGGTSSTSGSGIAWEKGALIKCQITAPFDSMATFSRQEMNSTIYMMVERPAKTYW